MAQRQSSPTVTLIEDAGKVRIFFAFSNEAIRRLKDLGDCMWDPAERCWWTRPGRRRAVVALFERLGYEVVGDVPYRQATPTPRLALASPAETYLRSLPARLQPPVFRALALVLHPDRDGDVSAMVALNQAWDRLKVAS